MKNREENGNGSGPTKRVPVLPSLITLSSTVCGFGAICLAARNVTADNAAKIFGFAAWLIILGMIFDALDGHVARLTRQTSDFGGHLDSLSDVISFGVAPGFLAWQVIKYSSEFPPWIERMVWLICVLYVVCTALRLARFDVSNRHDAEAHRAFVGLPSPPAAGMIASLVILQSWLADSPSLAVIVGRYVLPVTVLFLGPLMMSKLRYVHLLHELFKGRRSFPFFVELLFGLFLVVAFRAVLLPVIFAVYVMSGVVGVTIDKVIDRLDVSQIGRSFFK